MLQWTKNSHILVILWIRLLCIKTASPYKESVSWDVLTLLSLLQVVINSPTIVIIRLLWTQLRFQWWREYLSTISILYVEKSGSPGWTPTSVFHQDTEESTWIKAQFLQTPTQSQLPGYRIVSTPTQFTPNIHLDLLPVIQCSVRQKVYYGITSPLLCPKVIVY